jgi:hypothetical protein
MEKLITYIYYLHLGDNTPIYVGKSVNPKSRLINHRHEKNQKFFMEIIDEIPTVDWKFWEEFYISLFKSWNFDLPLNLTNKGRGCVTHNVSQEARKIIGETHKGKLKPFSEEHKKNHKKSYINRQVTWGDKISEGLKNRKNTWGGGGKPGTPILQYDLDGNFIKRWNGIYEASKACKCDVSAFLRGKQKQAGGFIWKYE